ncbi:hypothetical protein C4544_00935 [candidate division WS5 bacterium]|uniref:Uncharacterized protein n=1 Tax=candidate division WS5 bacterium TaxID=2093353 RepID=A0A419DG85_9BACT|nr:MAG: hypothetical protein C4544_00935 [candidate division WS5 bacterium]
MFRALFRSVWSESVPDKSPQTSGLQDVIPAPLVWRNCPSDPFDPGNVKVVVPATAGAPRATVPDVAPFRLMPALPTFSDAPWIAPDEVIAPALNVVVPVIDPPLIATLSED